MLNDLRAEQNHKQKALQLKKEPKPRTKEVGVQPVGEVHVKTIDASTQTDSPDILNELKGQVQNLMKVVEELTSLKRDLKDGENRATPPLINEEFSDDETFRNIVGDAIRTMCQDGEGSDNIKCESPTIESSQVLPNLGEQLPVPLNTQQRISSNPATLQVPVTYASPPVSMPRAPLRSIDPNATSLSGLTETQRQKVEGIVQIGKQMSTCALACVDILFSEEELANGNTGGARGFQQLNCEKLHFLMSVLRRKFDSLNFVEQWDLVKTKINTKCRGKRRTLVQRLKKDLHVAF